MTDISIPTIMASRRATLFRETPTETAMRCALGSAWALKPDRIGALPQLARLWCVDLVGRDTRLPHADNAAPLGLCGIANDLSVPTLVEAYRRGLYPFAHVGRPLWWFAPARCVLDFKDFHMTRRLRSKLRQQRHRVTFDRDFEGVIKACAEPRSKRWPLTWITPRMMHAYADLHDAGHAHSYEVWDQSGELVGGGYGVAVGGAFSIESQFSRTSGASKIGFSMLNWHLARWGFTLNDNKAPAQNVLEMGFQTISHEAFQPRLAAAVAVPGRTGRWDVETDLKTIADWKPESEVKACETAAAPDGQKRLGIAVVAALAKIECVMSVSELLTMAA